MSEEKVLPVDVEFAGISCRAVRSSYHHGGSTAVVLEDADGSPVITASVNIAGVSETMPDGQFALKEYSEGERLLAALEEAGIVKDTGKRVATGFVESPVVRLLY